MAQTDLERYVHQHVELAFDLYQTLRAWGEEHGGDTGMVLMEGAIRGLQEALESRLVRHVEAMISHAARCP